MNRAVFLDRDGTINVEKNYLSKKEDFEYLPGAIKALRILQDMGFFLIIVTNQSGIARGYYTEEDFVILTDWMIEDLKEKGVCITDVYYCPHHPEAKVTKYKANCECRKPQLGLYEHAINEYNINIKESYAIGDKLRDLKVCEKGCRGFLIENNEKLDILLKVKNGEYKDIFYQSSLLECALKIKENEEKKR